MENIHPEFEFYRGSTPSLSFSLPLQIDKEKDKVFVTFTQEFEDILELDFDSGSLDISGHTLIVSLSQNQTLMLKSGGVDVQIRYALEDGTCDVSDPVYGYIGYTQKDGEIV